MLISSASLSLSKLNGLYNLSLTHSFDKVNINLFPNHLIIPIDVDGPLRPPSVALLDPWWLWRLFRHIKSRASPRALQTPLQLTSLTRFPTLTRPHRMWIEPFLGSWRLGILPDCFHYRLWSFAYLRTEGTLHLILRLKVFFFWVGQRRLWLLRFLHQHLSQF